MPTRFNPPPGWPPHPQGWMPPPGWQPDPSWPDPPLGWPLWVEDRATGWSASTDFPWMIGGGAAIFLGSLLPFISSTSEFGPTLINSSARATSAIFGLIIVGLGLAMKLVPSSQRFGSWPKGLAIGVPTLALAAFGALGYILFAVAGAAGIQQPTGLGFSEPVTYSPNIGLIMAILGCVAAGFGAIRTLQRRNHDNPAG